MNVDKFLDLYKELELNVRAEYNLDNNESISYFLAHNIQFIKYEKEIRYMSDIRNLLSHNPKINGQYVIDISDETISFINNLIREIKNRKILKDIMVPINKVHFAYLNTNVVDIISNLSNKIYNHVPIKDDGKIVGVFDEMSLFNMVKDRVVLSDTLKFKDLEKYIEINDRGRQVYLNANENTYVDEMQDIFAKQYKEGKRIGLVFVENNQKELVGIISTTDILGNKNLN